MQLDIDQMGLLEGSLTRLFTLDDEGGYRVECWKL